MVRFQQCERGSVAIIGGLVAMALMIATGIAIDHSRALELQAAADYAVLAALNPLASTNNRPQEAERLFRASLAPNDRALVGQVSTKAADATSLELNFKG